MSFPASGPMGAGAPTCTGTVEPQQAADQGPQAGLVLRLLAEMNYFLPNDIACTARLVCKELSQFFSSPQHRTVRLSRPLPPHAVGLWQCWEAGLRRLSFRAKLQLLSTAAVSGCETNLEVAWRLVQPGLIAGPEGSDVPYSRYSTLAHKPTGYGPRKHFDDPCTTAALHGHGHLLVWLVEHGWFAGAQRTVEAVAEHCDLAALQHVWQHVPRAIQISKLAAAAARSSTPDALGKMRWLLRHARLEARPAMANRVAATGKVARLQWLSAQGVQPGLSAVSAALASPAAGWDMLEALEQQGAGSWLSAWRSFSRVSYNKLEWAASRPGVVARQQQWNDACCEAARAGDLPAVARLHEAHGAELSECVWQAAAASGSTELLSWLHARGCARTGMAVEGIALAGDLPTLAWLLREVPEPLPPCHVGVVIRCWPEHGGRGAARPQPAVDQQRAGAGQAPAGAPAARAGEAAGLAHRAAGKPCGGGAASADAGGEGGGGVGAGGGGAGAGGGGGGGGGSDLLRAVQLALEAKGGHSMEQLSWALHVAAFRGDLPLLQLLHGRRVGYSDATVVEVVRGGCGEALEWLAGGGSLVARRAGDMYKAAGENGDAATLRALLRLGVPCGEEVMRVLWDKCPDAARFMAEELRRA